MSTRKASTPQAGPEDGEEKPSEGTPDLEGRQREAELRDKAILQQKRRLKQATQFVHKDSADLLPLDGLKRLGTSKDLVSPRGPSLDGTLLLMIPGNLPDLGRDTGPGRTG